MSAGECHCNYTIYSAKKYTYTYIALILKTCVYIILMKMKFSLRFIFYLVLIEYNNILAERTQKKFTHAALTSHQSNILDSK